jgi:hypothetical protein
MAIPASRSASLIAKDQCTISLCWILPMNTTSTAQYAAVAAKTSCLLALVKTETAVAKTRAKIIVIAAINFADMLQVRNI